jgi:hypothetical protein
MTVAIKKVTSPKYAAFIRVLEYLKLFVVLSEALFKIFFARTYVPAMQHVAESLSTKNRGMLPTTAAIKGLSSTAPKYKSPMIVVMQSMVPMSTSTKLGNMAVFIGYILPSPFSLPFSSQEMPVLLKNDLSKLDIFQLRYLKQKIALFIPSLLMVQSISSLHISLIFSKNTFSD